MTHKQKVLALLSDGEWHSHHEGYALNVILHSRVDDLRHDDGYVIEHKREGRVSWYRMVQGCVEASGTDGHHPSGASTEPSAALSSMPPPAEGSQLVLTGEPFRRKAAA